MGRLLAIAATAAAVGIAIIAINGPGLEHVSAKAGTPTRSSSGVSAAGAGGAAPARHAPVGATVVMRNLAFSPARVAVRRGQAVRFVNHDDVAHTVVQDIGAVGGQQPLFASRRIPPGGSFTYVTAAAGDFAYVCSLHPTVMHGRIVVRSRS